MLTAAQIMVVDHPLYNSLVTFCGSNPVTKRQATKFLQKYPQYRRLMVAMGARDFRPEWVTMLNANNLELAA